MSGRRATSSIRHQISRLLSPRLCLCCDRPTSAGLFLCPLCAADLPRVSRPCRLCGLPNPAAGGVCPACHANPPRWQRMIAPLAYDGPVRRLIRDFKFHEQLYAGRALVELLARQFDSAGLDALLPVPLHRTRLVERGFNQSLEISRLLAIELGIPVDRHMLQRVRATDSQAGLSLHGRRNNLLGAFSCHNRHAYRRVAVIDDVITTGSTIDEIARTLRRNGVERIEAWGLARVL